MIEVETLFALFGARGGECYGEDVTQLDHALQAAHGARTAGDGDLLVVACLLHDIGQLLGDAGLAADVEGRDAAHEVGGAAFLAGNFPEAVLAPIRLHVAAKRYLCHVDANYQRSLSEASLLSLALQGGAFTDEQARDFLALPFATDALRLRRHDDAAKEVGMDVPDLASYRGLIEAAML